MPFQTFFWWVDIFMIERAVSKINKWTNERTNKTKYTVLRQTVISPTMWLVRVNSLNWAIFSFGIKPFFSTQWVHQGWLRLIVTWKLRHAIAYIVIAVTRQRNVEPVRCWCHLSAGWSCWRDITNFKSIWLYSSDSLLNIFLSYYHDCREHSHVRIASVFTNSFLYGT